MDSRISELHQKGQYQSILRQAIKLEESVIVYVPGEYAKESAEQLLLMLSKQVKEKEKNKKLRLNYEIVVGTAPGKNGDFDKESGRRIVIFSGYSRF